MKRIAVLMGLMCLAQGALAADLLDLYRDARSNDSQFASASAALTAGREKGPQGVAGLLPTIGFTASSTYNDGKATVPVERSARYNANGYTLQLTQPLFRWQNWVGAKQGDIQVAIAEAQYSQAQMDLIVRVAQAYFDVLYAQDVLASVQALKAANDQQLQLAKRSFEVGTVTVTDVYDAQSRFDLASAQEIAAINDLAVKREALRVITGSAPQLLAPLRVGVDVLAPQPDSMDAWVSAAQSTNANVQASQLSYELAQREVERARAGHLPTVDLVATHNYNHNLGSTSSGLASRTEGNAVGVQLSLPIFAGGATQSRVRETLALADKANSDLETARRNAAQAARQSYLGVTSGLASIRGYEAALRSGQSSVDANKLGYEVGVRINIDVLNAQSVLADTQQKLAKARYDAIMSQLRLKNTAGGLSIDDVEQINGLLVR
ncbi:MAG: TolC family outer membrane protein [Rhodocyclaceae bacterium]